MSLYCVNEAGRLELVSESHRQHAGELCIEQPAGSAAEQLRENAGPPQETPSEQPFSPEEFHARAQWAAEELTSRMGHYELGTGSILLRDNPSSLLLPTPDAREVLSEGLQQLARVSNDPEATQNLLTEMAPLAEGIRDNLRSSTEQTIEDLALLRSFYRSSRNFHQTNRLSNPESSTEANIQAAENSLSNTDASLRILRNYLRATISDHPYVVNGQVIETPELSDADQVRHAQWAAQISLTLDQTAGLTLDLRNWQNVLRELPRNALSREEELAQQTALFRSWSFVREVASGAIPREEGAPPIPVSVDEATQVLRDLRDYILDIVPELDSSLFEGETLSYLEERLNHAIDTTDSDFLQGLTPQYIQEFIQMSDVVQVLETDMAGRESNVRFLRQLQIAVLYTRLGLTDRVEESLAGTEEFVGGLATVDEQIQGFMELAQLYGSAGMQENQVRVLEQAQSLGENSSQTRHQELGVLARAMVQLNRGEMNEAEASLSEIPENELAQTLLERLSDGRRQERLGRVAQIWQGAVAQRIAQLREDENPLADAMERDMPVALREAYRRVSSGESPDFYSALRSLRNSSVNALLLEDHYHMHELTRLSNAQLSDEAFAREVLDASRAYVGEEDYGMGQFLATSLLEDSHVGTEARRLINNEIPEEMRTDLLLESGHQLLYFVPVVNVPVIMHDIITVPDDELGSTMGSVALTVIGLGLAQKAGVMAETAWTGSRLARGLSPTALRLTGWGARSSAEAATFSSFNMGAGAVQMGTTEHLTTANFGREFGSMLVMFALLRGAAIPMRRLSAPVQMRLAQAEQALAQAETAGVGIEAATARLSQARMASRRMALANWGSRVAAFTASGYVNEAVGLQDASDAPLIHRLLSSALIDRQMIYSGRIVNGLSGGRLHAMERANQARYAQRAIEAARPEIQEILRDLEQNGLMDADLPLSRYVEAALEQSVGMTGNTRAARVLNTRQGRRALFAAVETLGLTPASPGHDTLLTSLMMHSLRGAQSPRQVLSNLRQATSRLEANAEPIQRLTEYLAGEIEMAPGGRESSAEFRERLAAQLADRALRNEMGPEEITALQRGLEDGTVAFAVHLDPMRGEFSWEFIERPQETAPEPTASPQPALTAGVQTAERRQTQALPEPAEAILTEPDVAMQSAMLVIGVPGGRIPAPRGREADNPLFRADLPEALPASATPATRTREQRLEDLDESLQSIIDALTSPYDLPEQGIHVEADLAALDFVESLNPTQRTHLAEAAAQHNAAVNVSALLNMASTRPNGNAARFLRTVDGRILRLLASGREGIFTTLGREGLLNHFISENPAQHLEAILGITDVNIRQRALSSLVIHEFNQATHSEAGTRLLRLFGIHAPAHESFPHTTIDLLRRADLYPRLLEFRSTFTDSLVRLRGEGRRAEIEDFVNDLFEAIVQQDVQDTLLPYTPHDWPHTLEVMRLSVQVFDTFPAIRQSLIAQYGSEAQARTMVQIVALMHDIGYGMLRMEQNNGQWGLARGENKGRHAILSGEAFRSDFAQHMRDVFGIEATDSQFNEVFWAIERHGADKEGRAGYMDASDTRHPLLFIIRLADNLDLTRRRMRHVQSNPIMMDALNALNELSEGTAYRSASEAEQQRMVQEVRTRFIARFRESLPAEEATLYINLLNELNEVTWPHFEGCVQALNYRVSEGADGHLIATIFIQENATTRPIIEGGIDVLGSLFQIERLHESSDSLTYNGQAIEIRFSVDRRVPTPDGHALVYESAAEIIYRPQSARVPGLTPRQVTEVTRWLQTEHGIMNLQTHAEIQSAVASLDVTHQLALAQHLVTVRSRHTWGTTELVQIFGADWIAAQSAVRVASAATGTGDVAPAAAPPPAAPPLPASILETAARLARHQLTRDARAAPHHAEVGERDVIRRRNDIIDSARARTLSRLDGTDVSRARFNGLLNETLQRWQHFVDSHPHFTWVDARTRDLFAHADEIAPPAEAAPATPAPAEGSERPTFRPPRLRPAAQDAVAESVAQPRSEPAVPAAADRWAARTRIILEHLRRSHPADQAQARQQLIARLEAEGLHQTNVREIGPALRRVGLRAPRDGQDTNIVVPVERARSSRVRATGWQPPPQRARIALDPAQIHFSQRSVANFIGPTNQMEANGALVPIKVVRLPDGTLVSYDNTRLLYAQRHNFGTLDVVIFDSTEAMPQRAAPHLSQISVNALNEYYRSQGTERTITRESRPQTWGEALLWRTMLNGLPITGTDTHPVVRAEVQ